MSTHLPQAVNRQPPMCQCRDCSESILAKVEDQWHPTWDGSHDRDPVQSVSVDKGHGRGFFRGFIDWTSSAYDGQSAHAKEFVTYLHANCHFVGRERIKYFRNQQASSCLSGENNVTWRCRTLILVSGVWVPIPDHPVSCVTLGTVLTISRFPFLYLKNEDRNSPTS